MIDALDILADHYRTTGEKILHRSHAKPETTARQVLAWYLVKHQHQTTAEVARLLSCAESTARYSVKAIGRRLPWERDLQAVCRRVVLDTDEGCGHPERFVALSGAVGCERCQEIAQGWRDCLVGGCRRLAPPDVKFCDVHEDDWQICADCEGTGGGECGELDCHGAYCDDGFAVCGTCSGFAISTVEKVPA